MGLFFEKRIKKKSTKPFIILKILITLAMLVMLVMAFLKDHDFYFLGLFILLGLNSLIGGIENNVQKEDKKIYLLDFVFGVIFFTLGFQFL